MRPTMLAGPMLRHFRSLTRLASDAGVWEKNGPARKRASAARKEKRKNLRTPSLLVTVFDFKVIPPAPPAGEDKIGLRVNHDVALSTLPPGRIFPFFVNHRQCGDYSQNDENIPPLPSPDPSPACVVAPLGLRR